MHNFAAIGVLIEVSKNVVEFYNIAGNSMSVIKFMSRDYILKV